MSNVRTHISNFDVALMLNGFEHTTWHTNRSTVLNNDKGDNYIAQGVVHQMLEIAYNQGAKKAARQLTDIKAILKD